LKYRFHLIPTSLSQGYSARVSELVAFVFRDQFRAPEVLNELRRRDFVWSKDLDEAVAVTLDEDGKARVQLSVDISNHGGAGWVRFWGSLLSSTLFMQGTEVMVEACEGLAASNNRSLRPSHLRENMGEAGCWKEVLASAVNFKRDVAALIEPSGSAIFMLLRAAEAPVVLRQLRNYGDRIVHTSLSSEQDRKVFAFFASGKENRS
jgi:uncharacterized membrane protein